MYSEKRFGAHPSASKSDTPTLSEGPQTGQASHPPVETSKDQSKQHDADDPESSSESSSEDSSADNFDVDGEPDSDSDSMDWEIRGKTPDPVSGPCTCRCGGCCCHTTASEPQHCVRCHTDYTFNHSQACSVPHVFYSYDRQFSNDSPQDLDVRSVCCGSRVSAGEPIKGDWLQPFPCFMGWHTTDAEAAKDQYNGLNILRCVPDRDGKCRRKLMKHHPHYRNLYDDKVKYTKNDADDRQAFLNRKKDELGDRYRRAYAYVEEEEDLGKRKTRKGRYY